MRPIAQQWTNPIVSSIRVCAYKETIMTAQILHFFKRNHIEISDIKYILREDNKTCLYLTDGRTVRTYITVKDFFEILESYDFLSINKGTVVCRAQISHIENGCYHMLDGRQLEGRRRTMAAHRRMNDYIQGKGHPSHSANEIIERFSILNNLPVAFCVIEMIFNENGSGIDFIFRYCNHEMEVVEGKTMNEMLNHSFCHVFPNADHKWIAAYTEVAVNGGVKHLRDFSPEIGKDLFIKCFQPLEGFCACLLIPMEDLTKNSVPAALK